jgi:hypothetical protein
MVTQVDINQQIKPGIDEGFDIGIYGTIEKIQLIFFETVEKPYSRVTVRQFFPRVISKDPDILFLIRHKLMKLCKNTEIFRPGCIPYNAYGFDMKEVDVQRFPSDPGHLSRQL